MKISDRFARIAALKPPRPAQSQISHSPLRSGHPEIPDGASRLADLLSAAPRRNHFGEHLALRKWFPPEHFAAKPLSSELAIAAWPLLAPNVPQSCAEPRQWLFLDTETTGLAGGTGTVAFLIGMAWWDAGGLEVEQIFLREPSEEHSALTAIAERMAERPVLVTFNGKSFDWPLLETRYRMTRSIDPPDIDAHLDFLHPARNLWRLRLGSVRLAELERHVLGWNRGADIISEMIPHIYFDYLRGGDPDPLLPIFRHNQMDLVGLARLAARVVALLAHPETHGQDAFELFGASRICEHRGHADRARTLYQRSIDGDLPPATDRAARHSLARLAKRAGDHSRAREIWEGMLGNSPEGFEAYEQLAIYYERRAQDPEQALRLARQAIAELLNANLLGLISAAKYRSRRLRFEGRIQRLESRIGKLPLAASPKSDACGTLHTEMRAVVRENARPAKRRTIQQPL
jgi:uncharacterized protein YprB with RNaseH-like and TPR domain